MNSKLSKALTGAAWFLVGIEALKEVWRTSSLPTNKTRSKWESKRVARKELSDASSARTSSPSQ
jgi:hypothetical protein